MGDRGPEDNLIEHCVSTVLVFDAVGSTRAISGEQNEEAGVSLDRILIYAKQLIREADGALINFSGDGGVAVFGWPTAAEDHAERACEVACRLHDRPDGLDWPTDPAGKPLRLRIGVHSGLVGFRRLTLDLGERTDTVGATTHLAAALEKQAKPGETLISDNAVRLCRRRVPLAPAKGPALFEEMGEPVFRLRGAPGDDAPLTTRQDTTPFVGREEEASAIMRRFAERNWHGGVCAVIGEPGIGKSRLLRETLRAIRQEYDIAVDVTAYANDSASPFVAADRIMRRLHETLGIEAPELNWADAASAARAAVAAFREAIGERRVLVVLDDLHFIDAESALFLTNLAEEGGTAILLAARPESRRAVDRMRAIVCPLEPLSQHAMEHLAEALVERQKLDESLSPQLIERADGLPFALEQLVFSVKAGHAPMETLIPDRVASLIHTRLNSLKPETKTLAQAISVIGDDLDEDELGLAAGLGAGEIRTAIAELKAFGILYPEARERFVFRHAIVGAACMTTLAGSRRRQLHSAALEAMIKAASSRNDRLAHHAEGAGEDEVALNYYWEIALKAHKRMASGSLIRIFRRALACMERIGVSAEHRLVDFVMLTMPSLIQLGEIDEMKEQMDRIGTLARSHGRASRMGGVLCQEGLIAWFEGDFETACAVSEDALALAEELGSAPMAFAARFNLANGWFGRGDVRKAIELSYETLRDVTGELAGRRLGAVAAPEVVAHAYLCWFLTAAGEYDDAEVHGAASWEAAKLAGDPYSEAIALGNYGRLAFLNGDLETARRRLEMLVSICDSNGFDAMYPHAVGLYASTLARLGRAREALDSLERCPFEAYAHRTGVAERIIHQIGYAEVHAALGERRDAKYAIERAVAIGRLADAPVWLTRALGVRSQLGLGPDGDARERAAIIARYELADAC